MAFVTETYNFALPRGINIPNPFVFKGILRIAGLLGTGLLAGSCLMTALGTVEAAAQQSNCGCGDHCRCRS